MHNAQFSMNNVKGVHAKIDTAGEFRNPRIPMRRLLA
jgi:hypothetical protein